MKKRIASLILAAVLLLLTGLSFASPGQVTKTSEGKKPTASSASAGNIYTADVIIVGAGGAGMTAAIQAVDAGVSVILLEKSSAVGGNTLPAQAGINAANTSYQAAKGIKDNVADFIKGQTNRYTDSKLVAFMVENSGAAVEWLKSLGMDLSIVEKTGTAAVARLHKPADGRYFGEAVTETLYANLTKRKVPILFNTRATSLIKENGKVTGVNAVDADGKKLTFKGNAILLATGGFGQDNKMVAKYRPDYAGVITSEIAPTTGDGLLMARAIGADAIDLDKIMVHAFVELTTHTMFTTTMRANDIIMVNQEGKRFVNEKGASADLLNGILKQTGFLDYVIFDKALMNTQKDIQKAYTKGIVTEAATVADLAKALGMDPATLEQTVSKWNTDFATGKDSQFGRNTGMVNNLTHPPYYAVKTSPGVHYCLGGLVINTDTQVLDVYGAVIPGLYAAGEVTGGVEGDTRVDGSAITDTFVYGRQAGIKSSAYALAQGKKKLVLPVVINKAVPAAKGNFKDGVYTGIGRGNAGEIKVQVTVSGGNIKGITVLSQNETPAIYGGVERTLIPRIIQSQSVKVDAVSGASMSSRGVLQAVANALGIK